MRYSTRKNVSKNNVSPSLFTQKQIIEQINAHTRFTRRFAELLIQQAYQIERKDLQNANK